MVFEVYVAGLLSGKAKEKLQMKDLVYALNSHYSPIRDKKYRLIIGPKSGDGIEIDGLLLTENRAFILEIKGFGSETVVDFDISEQVKFFNKEIDRATYKNQQKKWLVGRMPLEERNPLDQIGEQRNWLNRLLRGMFPDKGNSREMGNRILGWVVVKPEATISYRTPHVESYVRSQQWMKILRMGELIEHIDSYRDDPPGSFFDDLTINRIIAQFSAEKRPFNRWMSEIVVGEDYYEVSRVPYIDDLLIRGDRKFILEAIESAGKYNLKAYSEDLFAIYFSSQDPVIQEKVFEMLIKWDYPRLNDLILDALSMDSQSQVFYRVIRHLSEVNEYPETLARLGQLLMDEDINKPSYTVTGLVDAIGNLQTHEAGATLSSYLNRITGDDYYSTMLAQIEKCFNHQNRACREKIDSKMQLIAKLVTNLGASRYEGANKKIAGLFIDFPLESYIHMNSEAFRHPLFDCSKSYQFHFLDSTMRLLCGCSVELDSNQEAVTLARVSGLFSKYVEKCLDIDKNETYVAIGAMIVLKAKRQLPRGKWNKELVSLTEGQVATIIAASQEMKGWPGKVMAFAIPCFYYTGMRPKELKSARLEDLDQSGWVIKVSHPKGEDSWGEKRRVPICPPLRPYFETYLVERARRLEQLGLKDNPYLIPNLSGELTARGTPYVTQTFQRWKREIEQKTGVKFELRKLRNTCGQHLKDKGVPIEAISKLLGHSSTKTTETHYARMRDEKAFSLVEDAWSSKKPEKK